MFIKLLCRLFVPCSVIGAIIGKGGETIKKLQQDSGARIQFRPEETDGSPHRMCNISGSRDQISAAMDMMREIMESSSVSASPDYFFSIL